MAEILQELTLSDGYKVPRVGLGTAVGTWATLEQQDQVQEAVKSALRLGCRHIDTATLYNTEEPVGRALKECILEGTVQRQDVFVTTKLWCTCHRKQLVEPALRQSLQKMDLDYVDLYLIHQPFSYQPGDELKPKDASGRILLDEEHTDIVTTCENSVKTDYYAMEHCQKLGLTRSIGLSNFNERQIQRILDCCSIRPTVNQIESHPYHFNKKLIDFCQSKGITVACWAPLFPLTRAKKCTHLNMYEDPVLKEIAARHHRTVAQVALRFQLQRGLVVIPKSLTPSRQAENLNVFDFSLSEEDMSKIFQIPRKFRLSYTSDILKGAREYPYGDQ